MKTIIRLIKTGTTSPHSYSIHIMHVNQYNIAYHSSASEITLQQFNSLKQNFKPDQEQPFKNQEQITIA